MCTLFCPFTHCVASFREGVLFSLFSRVLKSPKKRPKRKERHEYHVPRVIHTYTFARLERDRDREILPRNDDGDEFEVFVVWPASEERERDQ